MENLGLITREASAPDRRIRHAVIAAAGKAMTNRIDAARERILTQGFRGWAVGDIETLARLMRRLADTMRAGEEGGEAYRFSILSIDDKTRAV